MSDQLAELQTQYNNQLELFQERITQLELALEDSGWYRLVGDSQQEFSRQGLRQIVELCRIFYLKNPLIQRGVNVTAYYVFGQGVTIKSPNADVNAVIQKFMRDVNNRAELTTQQAMNGKEHELELSGNLFFVFFTNKSTGRVQIRTIPVDEVEEIVTNPQDRKDPWYYKRMWVEESVNPGNGVTQSRTRTAYYPDWHFNPRVKNPSIGQSPVNWDSPVFHVKVGGLTDMRFGVSEVYAAIDWAWAYKNFLEDWATIVRAYARFAWQLKTKGGLRGIQAAKTKLNTTISTSSGETNPPPTTGSTFIGTEGTDMQPMRTAGATTSAEDGRRLLLMVAATTGLPESFFGDVSVGTLATAKSLDRPTELKMRDRQSLWSDVFVDILEFVVTQAIVAPQGRLAGKVRLETDPDGSTWLTMPDGKPVVITCTFPPILEHDVVATVSAIVQAATLAGGAPAGTIDMETVTRQLCQALGIQDVDAVLAALGEGVAAPADGGMVEAARALKEAVIELREKYAASH